MIDRMKKIFEGGDLEMIDLMMIYLKKEGIPMTLPKSRTESRRDILKLYVDGDKYMFYMSDHGFKCYDKDRIDHKYCIYEPQLRL